MKLKASGTDGIGLGDDIRYELVLTRDWSELGEVPLLLAPRG
jgi:hypothetical protein